MIKVISGGQTGADLGALDAALVCGFQTGGTAPFGFRNERGLNYYFVKKYGLASPYKEPKLPFDIAEQYRQRTKQNVDDADLTVWFEWSNGRPSSRGYHCTSRACTLFEKELIVVNCGLHDQSKDKLIVTLSEYFKGYSVVNFAGNRESKATGIYDWVYGLLCDVFQELRKEASR